MNFYCLSAIVLSLNQRHIHSAKFFKRYNQDSLFELKPGFEVSMRLRKIISRTLAALSLFGGCIKSSEISLKADKNQWRKFRLFF